MSDDKYIEEGFNHGYDLARLQPELAKQLAQNFQSLEKPYSLGFTAGMKEWEREKLRTRAKLINRAAPSPKLKDKSKDRDDREMDR